MLKVGDKAPDFSVKSDDNVIINLKDFVGKKNLVLYFYPEADTPG
jgi:peroxiredoxin Q/BCP